MFGEHVIKHWSGTQTLIALSSGEAEYYGCVRAASSALGVKSMLKDLGVNITRMRVKVKTDSSVAKSLAARRGLGGIRHIEVNQLWLQEKVNKNEIEVEKVKGQDNLSDALTKYKDGVSLNQQLIGTNQMVTEGRHRIAPKLSRTDPLEDMSGETEEEQLNDS